MKYRGFPKMGVRIQDVILVVAVGSGTYSCCLGCQHLMLWTPATGRVVVMGTEVVHQMRALPKMVRGIPPIAPGVGATHGMYGPLLLLPPRVLLRSLC